MKSNESFDRWLRHITTRLKGYDFIFIVSDSSVLQELEHYLHKADEETAKAFPWLMRLVGYMYGLPGPLHTFLSQTMKIQHQSGDLSAAERLFNTMREHFPLSAFRISLSGIQYFACLYCDSLDQKQLTQKAEIFANLAWEMKQAVGKFNAKVLGISLGKAQENNVHASLCFTFTDQTAFNAMESSVRAIDMRTMSIGEKM